MGSAGKLCASVALAMTVGACASGYGSTRTQPRGFLRFEVKPDDAVVEIDEEYNGLIAGWAEGVVPVAPGLRRITLRAEGYMTQRFDVEVAAYEEVTFVLALEPVLELDEPDDAPARARTWGTRPTLERPGF